VADTLALEQLYAAVVTRFTAEGTAAANVFGWRASAQQIAGGARIAWKPGTPSGDLGKLGPARNPGRNPRPIATLRELFTVDISAVDPAAPEDESAQYHATRMLYDAWLRAVHLAAYGTYTVESEQWLIDKLNRRHGTAVRVVCSIEAMVPDLVQTTVDTDTSADVTVILGSDDSESGVIEGGGEIDTGEGGGASAATGVVYKADEPLSALRVVRSSGAGHVVYARPPEPEANAPIGITTLAALTGEDISIATGGTLQDASWSWTAGLPVLMGPNGVLTQTQPPGQGVLVAVGTAIEGDTIVVRIEPPIFTLD
jgi:hypothetical protein